MAADRRRSVKTKGLDFKTKLRDECFKQLAVDRDRLLWAVRQKRSTDTNATNPSSSSTAASVHSALQDLVQSVGLRIATPLPSTSSSSSRIPTPSNIPAEFNLPPDEYQQLMADLEASLAMEADLLREEAEFLERIEQQELEEYVAAHQMMTGDDISNKRNRGDSGGGISPITLLSSPHHNNNNKVMCPVCQQRHLVQTDRGVILCPSGDLRLDVSIEGLSLEHLRSKLEEVWAGHGRGGCQNAPQFGVRGEMLFMSCQQCNAFEMIT